MENAFGGAEVGAAADVAEENEFIFQLREDGDEVVDVEVLADAGAFAVVGLEEGAFGEEDFGVADAILEESFAHGGVAGVGDEGDVEAVGDFFAGLFHFAEDVAGEILGEEIGAEFFAAVDDEEADGGDGVAGGEGADDEAFAEFVFIANGEGDDGVFGDFAFEAGPRVDDVGEGFGDFWGAQDGAGFHALKEALGEVVGDAGGVIDVAVGEEAEVGDEGGPWAFADVEIEVEFGDLEEGFFAGGAVSEDVEVGGFDDGEAGKERVFAVFDAGRAFGGGGRNGGRLFEVERVVGHAYLRAQGDGGTALTAIAENGSASHGRVEREEILKLSQRCRCPDAASQKRTVRRQANRKRP